MLTTTLKDDSMLRFLTGLSFSLTICLLAGCAEETEFQDYTDAELSENTGHGHAGAHGGHVIELSDSHEYHAEVTFDTDSRDITVYFYGAKIGEGVPASDFVFELDSDEGEAELAAAPAPLEGETEETASCFVVAGANVPESITGEEQINAHFHVTLGGNEYVGELHAHSHGDAHDHGDHDDHAEHGDHDEGEHDEHAEGEHGDDEGHEEGHDKDGEHSEG